MDDGLTGWVGNRRAGVNEESTNQDAWQRSMPAASRNSVKGANRMSQRAEPAGIGTKEDGVVAVMSDGTYSIQMKDFSIIRLRDSKAVFNKKSYGEERAYGDVEREARELLSALRATAVTKKFAHLQLTGEPIDSFTGRKLGVNGGWKNSDTSSRFCLNESSGLVIEVVIFHYKSNRRVLLTIEWSDGSCAMIFDYPSYQKTTLSKKILEKVDAVRREM